MDKNLDRTKDRRLIFELTSGCEFAMAQEHQFGPGYADTLCFLGSQYEVINYVLAPSPRIGEAVAAAGVLSARLPRVQHKLGGLMWTGLAPQAVGRMGQKTYDA